MVNLLSSNMILVVLNILFHELQVLENKSDEESIGIPTYLSF